MESSRRVLIIIEARILKSGLNEKEMCGCSTTDCELHLPPVCGEGIYMDRAELKLEGAVGQCQRRSRTVWNCSFDTDH
jgi:hypothetical protein